MSARTIAFSIVAALVVAALVVVGAGTITWVQGNRAEKTAPKPNYLSHPPQAEMLVVDSGREPLVRLKAPLRVDADTGQVWHLDQLGEWEEIGWIAPQLRSQRGAK